VLAWARDLFSLANEGLEALHAAAPDPRGDETVYLAPLGELLARGESPADALRRALDATKPLAEQVVAHARL
jgi:hypothetical protein